MATYNGIPIEFEPPCEEDDQLLFLLSVQRVKDANRLLEGTGWQWVQTGVMHGRPVYEMKQEGRNEQADSDTA